MATPLKEKATRFTNDGSRLKDEGERRGAVKAIYGSIIQNPQQRRTATRYAL
jgi:hypothetical protein